jgi:hypothetical protein
MCHVKNVDVEALLRREVRSSLPLGRQFLLYLDPFALFKDASRGSAAARERALSYNRAMRWMLLLYIRRWIMIGALFLLGVAPVQALAAQKSFFILPAATLAVGACVAVAVIVWTAFAYCFLAAPR